MSNKLKLTIFFIARLLGLFALFRQITSSQVRILCYHGGVIGDEDGYNPKLFFSEHTFEKRMQWLRHKGFSIVPLDSVNESGPLSRLPTVITFDDGWYSTASKLLPVLDRLDMPSTLYLCTSHFLEGYPIANVATRYIIWKSLLHNVTLQGLGTDIDGDYSLRSAKQRESLATKIVPWINTLSDHDAICSKLEQFSKCMSVQASDLQLGSRRFQYVNPEELLLLAAQGCSIELHGHIHRYPVGDPAALNDDLQRCFNVIDELGLPRPKHYCYPSGSFDAYAPTIFKKLGVLTATTCVPGLISKVDAKNCYFLPRFLDGGSINTLEFEAEMSGFAPYIRQLSGNKVSANY